MSTDYEAIMSRIRAKAKSHVDAYPFNVESFLTFSKKQYPELTDREQKQIAAGIYRWFYGENTK